MSAPRLLDYFAVYGLSAETEIEGSEVLKDHFNVITALRLIVLDADETIRVASDFITYLELLANGGKKLWLEVVYGRLRDAMKPGWSHANSVITTLALFYMPFEDGVLQIPEDQNFEPVHVMWGGARVKHGLKKIEGGLKHYIGNYELTTLLGAKEMQSHKLVMVYRTQAMAQGTELPIVDIRMVPVETTKTADGKMKRTVKVPDQYEHLSFQFGKKDIRFLCFRRRNPHAEKDPLTLTYKPAFIEKFPRADYPDSPLPAEISGFCFPDGIVLSHEPQSQQVFVVVLTPNESENEEVTRLYITCLLFHEPMSSEVANRLNMRPAAGRKVYVPKCIALVSHWPYVDRFKKVLKQLYRIQMSSNDVPIERVICNLLQEVPLPDQGGTEIQYYIGSEIIPFSRPPAKYLSLAEDCCFEMLFRCLRIEDVISLWTAAMLERKILLISSKKSLLTYCAMGLTALLFPFKWCYGFIPVLPTQLKDIIEAIFPYIIGVSPAQANDAVIPSDALRVFLDEGRIVFLEPVHRLPDKPRKQLFGKLSQCANYYKKDDPVREASDEAFGFLLPKDDCDRPFNTCEVRDAFLELQTTLLHNYQRFLLLPGEVGQKFRDSTDCFNTPQFLNYHKANKAEQFLAKLVETQHFVHFIESRCFHADTNLEYAYFDELGETYPTLTVNDIGLEPEAKFVYNEFPKLNDEYFTEPRQVKQFAAAQGPKPTLALRDDLLRKMGSSDWAKFLVTTIFRLWFLTFSYCMGKYKNEAENQMKIALSILELMKKKATKPDEEIYRRLISACGHCGLKDVVLLLFKSKFHLEMKSQGIEPDALTHGVYVKAVSEGQEPKRQSDEPITLSDLVPNGLALNLHFDSVVFLPSDTCPQCGRDTDIEEIMSGWDKSYTNYTTKCACGANFIPRFHVVVDLVEYSEAAEMARERAESSLEVEFLSPPVLRKELENLIYSEGADFLLVRDFCDKHKVVFWNLVLFFQFLKLPIYFLDPNFDSEGIEELARECLERPSSSGSRDRSGYMSPRRGRAPSVSAHSEEVGSETGSNASGHSTYSHTGVVDSKLSLLLEHRPRSSSKRSTSGSDSTPVKSVNSAIKKVFSGFAEEFKQENRRKSADMNLYPQSREGDES